MREVEKFLPLAGIAVAVLLTAIFGYLATKRQLTAMEAYGLQVLFLLIGLVGSYFFGRRTSKDVTREIVEPHARKAFRRLISLYRSISRVAGIIDGDDSDRQKIARVGAIIIEQIDAADDALEDWRDLVPEAVEELREKSKQEMPGNAQ